MILYKILYIVSLSVCCIFCSHVADVAHKNMYHACVQDLFIQLYKLIFMLKVIYLKMEPYLRQWFIHENGGVEPVRLRRGTPESNIFQAFISKKPEEWTAAPEDGSVAIVVPQYKSLDPEYWCYLPPKAARALYNCIKASLDVQLFRELHTIRSKEMQISDLIYAFMEKHGIEDTETNWNTLAKIYKRKLDSHRWSAKYTKKR